MTSEDMFTGEIRTMWNCPLCGAVVWTYRACKPCELEGLCKECYETGNHEEHREVESVLEDIEDRGLIYTRAGTVVIDTRGPREYPEIDFDWLGALLADNLFDWSAAIREYLEEKPIYHDGALVDVAWKDELEFCDDVEPGAVEYRGSTKPKATREKGPCR